MMKRLSTLTLLSILLMTSLSLGQVQHDRVAVRGMSLPNNTFITARNAAGSGDIQMWKTNASDKIEAGVEVVAAGGEPLFSGRRAYKSADESVSNSTTLQDDDHLTVALAANATYSFVFTVFHDTNTTADFKAALSGTVGVTSLRASNTYHAGTVAQCSFVTALGTSMSCASSTGTNMAIIEGSIETSTAGTLLLQWAQATADAGATTVHRNSTLRVARIQ